MERAMAETDRRRAKQRAYNEAHGITPKSVSKRVSDIMEGARESGRRTAAVAEPRTAYSNLSAAELGKSIAELEKQMLRHAELLEFEDAARVRDQINRLRKQALLSPEVQVWTD
jgi:excinuclease ABC subunit B